MDQPTPAPQPLSHTAAAARQLELWQQLRDQLQDLHAKLEYVRLMMRIEAGR